MTAGTTPSSRNTSFSRLSPHLLKESIGEGEGEAEAEGTGSDKSISSRKKRRSGEDRIIEWMNTSFYRGLSIQYSSQTLGWADLHLAVYTTV